MEAVGVRGKALAWFGSFLLDRRQRTAVSRHLSAVAPLHAGVPQSAVLSPLLSALYMNDIVCCTEADVNLFADDKYVFATDKSAKGLQLKLQGIVDQLSAWFSSWALTANSKKSALMLLTTKRSIPSLNVSINAIPITQVTMHKHLGLTLDGRFSWALHTSAVVFKASQKVGLLRRLRHRLPPLVIQSIYTRKG